MLVDAKLGAMEEDALQELRRSKLAAWLTENGGITAVAERCGLKASGRSYLSQVTNGYSFGSRAARSWEKKLGIESGWLDLPAKEIGSATDESSTFVASEPSGVYNTLSAKTGQHSKQIKEALRILGSALSIDMDNDVRDDLADALSKLARRRGAVRDQEQVLLLLCAQETGSKRAA